MDIELNDIGRFNLDDKANTINGNIDGVARVDIDGNADISTA